MATDYYDGLSEEDGAALEAAFANQGEIISGKGNEADALSKLVQDAPAIGNNVTIYRYYGNDKLLFADPVYSFTEPGFLVGTTKQPQAKDGATILAFKIPSGFNGIQVDDSTYIFDRGLTVYYAPYSGGIYPATVGEAFNGGKALTASATATLKFNTGYIPSIEEQAADTEEFYNHAHGRGGRFTSGGGSGGGGGGGQRTQGGGGNRGNQGQHNRHGQQQGGNRPASSGYQGKNAPKKTKVEQHANRTANIIRDVGTIIGVVITVASVINAVSNIQKSSLNQSKNAKTSRAQAAQDKEVQRRSNLLGLHEREARRGLPLTEGLKPHFSGPHAAEDKAIFDWMNK